MKNWQTETSIYLPRLESRLHHFALHPPIPASIPLGPLDAPPSLLQSVIHRAASFYEVGVWYRARDTMGAIIVLWREGYLSSAAAFARLMFELWGAGHFMTDGLRTFREHKDIARLAQVVNTDADYNRFEQILKFSPKQGNAYNSRNTY